MRALLTLLMAVTTLTASSVAAELTVAGAWVINRDLSTTAPQQAEGRRQPQGGGGRRGGLSAGIPGFGRGGGNGPSEGDMHKADVIRRRLTEIPERMIITRDGDKVTIVDEIGRSYTLKADGKKQERLTGDGEFTSKTRFDGTRLIVEDDFGGTKLTTTYTPMLEGGDKPRLEVRFTADGMPGAGRQRMEEQQGAGGRPGPPEVTRIYDADARPR
jgi:hypothetical protein